MRARPEAVDRRHRLTMHPRVPLLALLVLAVILLAAAPSAQAFDSYEGVAPTTIGEAGSGPGQLSGPGDIAVARGGDLYVADMGDDRVERLSPSGAFLSEIVGTPTGPGGEIEPFGGVGPIAVDDSTDPADPSAGDLYVIDSANQWIDKFTAAGQYVGRIIGTSEAPFARLVSIAVDPGGGLWAYVGDPTGNGSVDRFDAGAENAFRSGFATHHLVQGPSPLLAVDAEHVFLVAAGELLGYTYAGLLASHLSTCGCVTGLGLAPDPGDVLATEGATVSEFDAAGDLLQRFGAEGLEVSAGAVGVATDPGDGEAYVLDTVDSVIDAFAPLVLPDTTTGPVGEVGSEQATLEGTVEAAGGETTGCVFEYGPQGGGYEQTAPCSSPAQGEVSATVGPLQPGTGYHYRLAATNAQGTSFGLDRGFVVPAPLTIDATTVFDITAASATLRAEIDPGGVAGTYRFEYGPTAAYGTVVPVPDGAIEAAFSDVAVSQHLQGLTPQGTFHYRVVATGSQGEVIGPDRTFTTPAAGAAALPMLDGRAYEMVSPPDKDGAGVLGPSFEGGVGDSGGMVEAAEDGAGITYLANSPFGEPQGNAIGSQIVSTRGSQGWSSQSISTPHDTPSGISANLGVEYEAFSPDLSLGIVNPSLGRGALIGGEQGPPDPPLSPLSPPGYNQIYLRNTVAGGYQPLLTTVPPAAPQQFHMELAGASPDLHHVVVSMEGNLYEWNQGETQLKPVNILPGGGFATDAFVGNENVTSSGNSANTVGAISADGSQVVWDQPNGPTYLRDMATETTVQLQSSFQAASVDGTKVFLSDGGDLYLYESATEKASDMTVDTNPSDPLGAAVMGVIGANSDGSKVYFVAEGALAPGATSGPARGCIEGEPSGRCNLYVLHEEDGAWHTTFIAALPSADGSVWSQSLLNRTSRVSPSGRFLAFSSTASLTGYDNRDANSGQLDSEVFIYDSVTQRLVCASCNASGARPTAGSELPGWEAFRLPVAIYQPRYLSDSGRLFFESADALLPRDTNGQKDVYEWEPPGTGSCAGGPGCLGLVSTGTGAAPASFLDADAAGENAFFITRDRLLPQDFDDNVDLYDARVCTSASPCIAPAGAQPAPCAATDACRAAPNPQPSVFGAPASATFSGAGNARLPHRRKHHRRRGHRRHHGRRHTHPGRTGHPQEDHR